MSEPYALHVLEYTSCSAPLDDMEWPIAHEWLPGVTIEEIVWRSDEQEEDDEDAEGNKRKWRVGCYKAVRFRHFRVNSSHPVNLSEIAYAVKNLEDHYGRALPKPFREIGRSRFVIAEAPAPHKYHARQFFERVHYSSLAYPNDDELLGSYSEGKVSFWQRRGGDLVLVLADGSTTFGREAILAIVDTLEVVAVFRLELLRHDINDLTRQYYTLRDQIRENMEELLEYMDEVFEAKNASAKNARALGEFADTVLPRIYKDERSALRIRYHVAIRRAEFELDKPLITYAPLQEILDVRFRVTEVTAKQIDLDLELLQQPLEKARWASERYESWLQIRRDVRYSFLGLLLGIILGIVGVWPAAIEHHESGHSVTWWPWDLYMPTFLFMALPAAVFLLIWILLAIRWRRD